MKDEGIEVIWIKGMGRDMGTLTKAGITGFYTERLRNLNNVYGSLADEEHI
jgi:rhamnose utilization protein RhaD (predicted bifunctional aldolase and dehydrogenase)